MYMIKELYNKVEIVGKCLTDSVFLSLMASTTVKMAGSESASMDKQEQVGLGGISAESKFFQIRRMCKLGGELSLIVGFHPKFPTA
jgi:hypothetical protein